MDGNTIGRFLITTPGFLLDLFKVSIRASMRNVSKSAQLRNMATARLPHRLLLCCAVLCCVVLCCAVLCCAAFMFTLMSMLMFRSSTHITQRIFPVSSSGPKEHALFLVGSSSSSSSNILTIPGRRQKTQIHVSSHPELYDIRTIYAMALREP